MPVRDIVSDQDVTMVMNTEILTATDTNSAELDLAHADSGVMFFLACVFYINGTFTVALEDSPDNITWTAVPAAKVILPDGAVSISAATAPSDSLQRIGVFNVNRFVRLVVTSTGTVDARITGYGIRKSEIRPNVLGE